MRRELFSCFASEQNPWTVLREGPNCLPSNLVFPFGVTNILAGHMAVQENTHSQAPLKLGVWPMRYQLKWRNTQESQVKRTLQPSGRSHGMADTPGLSFTLWLPDSRVLLPSQPSLSSPQHQWSLLIHEDLGSWLSPSPLSTPLKPPA